MKTAVLVLIAWMITSAPIAQAITVADPVGDTFNSGGADLVAVSVTTGPASARFELVFADTIDAMVRALGAVSGLIDLDTDRNPATGGATLFGHDVVGGNSVINSLIAPNATLIEVPGPLVPLGSEFGLSLRVELDGFAEVLVFDMFNLSFTDFLPVTLGSDYSLVFEVPYDAIGGDDGQFNFSVLVGDFDLPTDRSPNGAFVLSTAVHEPSMAVLLAVSMLAYLGVRGRRRRIIS